MLKETKAEETIVFFVTFLSLVAFQLGGGGRAPSPPSGYAYSLLRHTQRRAPKHKKRNADLK